MFISQLSSYTITLTLFFLGSFIYTPESYANVDVNRALETGRAIANSYRHLLCQQHLSKTDTSWIIEKSLPSLMNKSFLGVSPPPQGLHLFQQLLTHCPFTGNLCLKETQDKFVLCAQDDIPMIMMVFFPWLNEHGDVINEHLINHWSERKQQLDTTLKEFLNYKATRLPHYKGAI